MTKSLGGILAVGLFLSINGATSAISGIKTCDKKDPLVLEIFDVLSAYSENEVLILSGLIQDVGDKLGMEDAVSVVPAYSACTTSGNLVESVQIWKKEWEQNQIGQLLMLSQDFREQFKNDRFVLRINIDLFDYPSDVWIWLVAKEFCHIRQNLDYKKRARLAKKNDYELSESCATYLIGEETHAAAIVNYQHAGSHNVKLLNDAFEVALQKINQRQKRLPLTAVFPRPLQ